MIKQTTKTEFLIKASLALAFAIIAGGDVAFQAEYFSHAPFFSLVAGFVYTFYPFACIVIMQWILFSDYLPKWWVALGFVGCTIAAIMVGIIFQFITKEFYNPFNLVMGTSRTFMSGMLLALPQLYTLKGSKGYLWVLANGVGWAIQFIAWLKLFFPPINDSFFLAFLRMLILESPSILYGLMIGLYLYVYIYNPKHLQSIEE